MSRRLAIVLALALLAVPARADLLADTADDEVVVVTVTPAPATVLRLAAPFQRSGGRSRIAGLSPDAFLIGSDGPDRKSTGADDPAAAIIDW